jgi:hypothetical protein
VDIPIYGSPEYHELPQDDPARLASIERAAEAWRLMWTVEAVAARLKAEINFNDQYTAWRLRQLSNDLSEGLQQ